MNVFPGGIIYENVNFGHSFEPKYRYPCRGHSSKPPGGIKNSFGMRVAIYCPNTGIKWLSYSSSGLQIAAVPKWVKIWKKLQLGGGGLFTFGYR